MKNFVSHPHTKQGCIKLTIGRVCMRGVEFIAVILMGRLSG